MGLTFLISFSSPASISQSVGTQCCVHGARQQERRACRGKKQCRADSSGTRRAPKGNTGVSLSLELPSNMVSPSSPMTNDAATEGFTMAEHKLCGTRLCWRTARLPQRRGIWPGLPDAHLEAEESQSGYEGVGLACRVCISWEFCGLPVLTNYENLDPGPSVSRQTR